MKLFAAILMILSLLIVPGAMATVYHDYYGSYGGDEWVSWEEDWLENDKSHATPPFRPRWDDLGCAILGPENTLLDDVDCDKIPDPIDNCLGVPNPDQSDQNQNGLGDPCDLVVDKIELDPQVVLEGRAFTVTATMTNYRPYDLRNLQLTVQVPELGLEQKEYVDLIAGGKQDHYLFYFRLPNCVHEKDYDVVLFVEWPAAPGQQEFFYIPTRVGVTSSGLCDPEGTREGKSIINILDIQDVDENGGIYPFTIVNAEAASQAYVLTVEGTEDWGNYEIRPRSLIIVPAGESREGELVIYANEDAEGEHGFVLTLRSKSDAHQELLSARIKQEAPGPSNRAWLQFGIFIAVLIILAASVGITIHRAQEQRHKRKRHHNKHKK